MVLCTIQSLPDQISFYFLVSVKFVFQLSNKYRKFLAKLKGRKLKHFEQIINFIFFSLHLNKTKITKKVKNLLGTLIVIFIKKIQTFIFSITFFNNESQRITLHMLNFKVGSSNLAERLIKSLPWSKAK